jgi:hypothetical protein
MSILLLVYSNKKKEEEEEREREIGEVQNSVFLTLG